MNIRYGTVWLSLGLSTVLAGSVCELRVEVIREESIDLRIPRFNNGASPGWNAGSPMLVRKGDDVWFSLSRPVIGEEPYANTFWQIYKRLPRGWKVVLEDREPRNREPCPIAFVGPDSLAIFVNPKTSYRFFREENQASLWDSHPHLIRFSVNSTKPRLSMIEPGFSSGGRFREHTYRGISVWPQSGEILLFVLDPDSELYYPTYRDAGGKWHPFLPFTFPIRSLYPNLFVRNGEAHVLAISDIKEPVAEWRKAKYEVFRRHWDYAFRDVYYTWTPDAKRGHFEPSILVDSIRDRPGYAMNLDLLVDEDGTAHILYLKQRFQYPFLRDQFFPDEDMSQEIGYARVKEGKMVLRRSLVEVSESNSGKKGIAGLFWGRLHRLEDGSLVGIYSADLKSGAEMYVVELDDAGKPSPAVRVPLKIPMKGRFFTNTERGGSKPGNRVDLLEMGYGQEYHSVRYAELEIQR